MKDSPDNENDARAKLVVNDNNAVFWYWVNFVAFGAMGAGANWVLPTALAQEIPYFENHSPEKLCVATYMNVANALGIFAIIAYLYWHHHVRPIAYTFSVPVLLLGSTLGTFFSAFVYNVSVGNVSLML